MRVVGTLRMVLLGLACCSLVVGCPAEDEEPSVPPIIEIPNPFGQPDAGEEPLPDEDAPATGGEGGGCCSADEDCPEEGQRCVIDPESGGGFGECLADVTLSGGCYFGSDCPQTGICEGASTCLCSDCETETIPGICKVPCCVTDEDCSGDAVCIQVNGEGQCNRKPVGDGCWFNSDCASNKCDGANPCSCGQECGDQHSPGACVVQRQEPDCLTDADCDNGSCMAGDECTDDCAAGDPSCCVDNQCIPQTNQCTTDGDCPPGGECLAGPICYDFCADDDPTCCFGNTCFVDKCAAADPTGCLYSGCPDGEACVVDDTCIPTACTCNPAQGWVCTDDCVGGQCMPTACIGPNPQGCLQYGCPEGQACVPSQSCSPTECSCDEATGAWACSADCDAGVCQ